MTLCWLVQPTAYGQDIAETNSPATLVPPRRTAIDTTQAIASNQVGDLDGSNRGAEPNNNPQTGRSPAPRIQSNFPSELLLPPPTEDALSRANRFVESTIDPELPLNLVLGRPKVLQLAKVPRRVYVPDDAVVRTEVVDQQSGREIAVTGLKAGSTTLILWFDDPNSPS
ncbi:MAG: pilus assembly protein N-terminal domain-containing protein, partial [Rubripirellula sp.]